MPPLRHRQVTKSYPGRKTIPSLRHWQITKSCTLPFLPGRKLCPVASLAGNEVMPYSAFAGQETWCVRAHGFARPRDSRLSEMSSCKFLRYRASASRELGTRDHRNEVTGQSPRHGASRMEQLCELMRVALGRHRRVTRLCSYFQNF